MNPLRFVTHPIGNLVDAVVMPFKALFVVGLCAAINAMTSPGHWWVKWVALGMGIAVLVAWARAARTLFGLALVALVGWWVWRQWGDQARARYDAWLARAAPQQHQLYEVLRRGPEAVG
ncbi:MAG: hypothetical protein IPL57_00385 [Rubrivivax sp.]|nr:hypothetical protein [Rubrivivax sp.]